MESDLGLRGKAIVSKNVVKPTTALILALATCCYAIASDFDDYTNSTLFDKIFTPTPSSTEFSSSAATIQEISNKAAPSTEEMSDHTTTQGNSTVTERKCDDNTNEDSSKATKETQRKSNKGKYKAVDQITEHLSFDDLEAFHSSPSDVKDKFEEIFDKKPDGIALNKEIFYDAVEPAITQQYGHYMYKQVKGYTFTSDNISSPEEAIVGSKNAINEGNTTAQMIVSVGVNWDETTSISSSITTGLEFHSEISVSPFYRMGGSLSFSVSAGKTETKTVSTSFLTSVKVDIPPKSMVEVTMVATTETARLEFAIPIRVNGRFGANFPNPVKDSNSDKSCYFWFVDARSILNTTLGKITGVIENTRFFNTKTKIGKAVAI